MWFDIHWHARDEEQSAKETIARSLQLAEAGGATAIAAMPNTTRPLTTLERCREYLEIADTLRSPVLFYVHIGLTPNLEQVKQAADAYRREPHIIGMKAYFGKSTGNLGIIHQEEQYKILETLAQEGYEGVLISHCEKESEMNDTAYDPMNPISWSTLCRPEEAEIFSVKDILRMAEEVHFRGKVHVAHVSTIEIVDLICHYQGPLQLSCGVTPHHVLLNNSSLRGENAAWYKCNPPLRSPKTQQALLDGLLQGKIPLIESDHAPHYLDDKMKSLPASGIANGWAWPYLIRHLQEREMPSEMIQDVTFSNAVQLYGLDIGPRKAEVNWKTLASLRKTYPFDAFQEIFES